MISLSALVARPRRAMDRKPKDLNGSPGRARTADLVINSSKHSTLSRQKVYDSQVRFRWPYRLAPWAELQTELCRVYNFRVGTFICAFLNVLNELCP